MVSAKRKNITITAQTIIQLLQQLEKEPFSSKEIQKVATAYDAMIQLSGCRIKPSGKPFLDHLVGVASITTRHRPELPMILAGLVHSAYDESDFGTFWPQPGPRAQQLIRDAIGQEAEVRVQAYSRTKWSFQSLQVIMGKFNALSNRERDVLFLRIANELEEAEGLDLLYYASGRREEKMQLLASCVEPAQRLDLPALAKEVEQAYKILSSAPIPEYSLMQRKYSFDIHPLSYRKRLLPRIGRKLFRVKKHWF